MTKLPKALFLSFLLLMVAPYANGQMLRGTVSELVSSKPIPFANIVLKDSALGTISNDEGAFALNLSTFPAEFTLEISCLGYKTQSLQLSKDKLPASLDIKLEESILELEEVVIAYLSPEHILASFYKNYPANYPQEPMLSRAFYHSTLSENGAFKHYLEATVHIREFEQKKRRAFEVEISQRRKSNDYRIEKWGEKNNYLYDAIASNPVYDLSGFLDEKKSKYYDISRESDTSFNDQLVYVLAFKPRKGISRPLYEARAYINAADFALIRAEYSFTNSRGQIKNQRLRDRSYHIPFVSGTVQYHKSGQHYIPKYLSFLNGWTIIHNVSGDTLSRDILKDEILFTETKTGAHKALSDPLSKWGDIYQKPFPYDPGYWNEQTKIPHTQLTRRAIIDLEKHQTIEVQYFNNASDRLLNQGFENSLGGKIDSVISAYHVTGVFNGVALISHGGKIVHHKAYGFRELENKVPLDTSSLFDIGSITKQFTAAMILKLREEGKLKLEDKVGLYLPAYRYAEDISIHQLLAHRSGIPGFDHQDELTRSSWFTSPMETRVFIDSFCSGALDFNPGSEMEYSNSNYLILTAVLEAISGKDYYSLLQEQILDPLELAHTYPPHAIPVPNVARGYVREKNLYSPEPAWEKANMKGVGCMYSSSSDLWKWLNVLHAKQFLSSESSKLMTAPISYYEYYESDFAYSWAINRNLLRAKSPAYFYGGTSLGFFSMITSIPKSETHIILLGNKGDFPRIELTNEILRILE